MASILVDYDPFAPVDEKVDAPLANKAPLPTPATDTIPVERDPFASKEETSSVPVDYDPFTQPSPVAAPVKSAQPPAHPEVVEPPTTFTGNIQESFVRGDTGVELDREAWEAMMGMRSWEEVKAKRDAFKALPPIGENSNLLSKAVQGVAGMLPAMGKGILQGQTAGLTAAVGAGAVNAVFPVAEPIAVPAAYAAGVVVGSFEYWARQGTGQIYADLRDADVSHDRAKWIAQAGGLLYAAIEFAQIDKIVPGLGRKAKDLAKQSLMKGLLKIALKAGKNVVYESLEEGAQQVVTDTATTVGKYIEGKLETKDVPAEAKQLVLNAWEQFYQTLGPMALLQLPGAMVAGKRSVSGNIKTEGPTVQSTADMRAAMRAGLVRIGIPEDTVDKSGVVDSLMAAKNDAERNKILESFAIEATASPPEALQEQPVEQAAQPQEQPIVGEPIPQPPSTVLNAPAPSEPAVMPEGTPATGKGVEPFTFDDENKTVDKYNRRVDGDLNLIAEPVAAVPAAPEAEPPISTAQTPPPGDTSQSLPGITPDIQAGAGGRVDVTAPVPATKPELLTAVDPNTLIFREKEQHRVEGMRNLDTVDFNPVVLIRESNGENTILDGHNRVVLAKERGDSINSVSVTRTEYDKLKKAGYDDIEISYAVTARMEDASRGDIAGFASEIARQFPGANVAFRGEEAKKMLEGETAPVPAQEQPATPVEPTIPTPAAAPPAPVVAPVEPAVAPQPPAPAKPVTVSEETPDIKQVGNDTVIRGTRDEEFQGKYVIVPRKTLIASHDPASLFAKNSEYPLENTRDYSAQSAEAQSERGKVIKIAQTFRPNEHVSLAGSASEGPVIAAHITDENGTRRLVVLGGNGRQMAIQSMSPAKQQALFEQTNKQAEQFGVQALPDAEHQLIRYIGEYDMRKAGVRAQVQAIVDSLNPSPGQVQSLSAMAKDDAQINIKMEDLSDISIEITEQEAQNKMNDLLASNKIDANTRKAIASNPAQAQEYMRRLLVHAAFRSQTLADYAQKTAREKLPGRILIEVACKSMIELRRKGETGIPDAVGKTLTEVIDYTEKGDTLPVALKKVSQQQQMDPTYGIVLDIATAMYDRVSLNKKGKINTDVTLDAFTDFWERVSLFVKAWEKEPALLFGEPMSIEVAFNTFLINLHKEQAAYNGEISTAPKDKRESRKKADIFSQPAPELPGTEVPFNLFSDVISPETRAAEEAKRAKRAEAEAQRELDARAQELGFMPEVRANSAQAKVDQFTANWKNKPKGGIVVVQTVEDADEFKLSSDSMSIIREGKTEGFYHIPSDTVVIIADNLNQTEDAIRVALHETTIHSGLRGLLGKEFDAELANIGKEIPASDLTDIALRYGLDLSKRADRLVAYEEYLAMYAETRAPKLYDRFIMAIKRALRAMGISDSVINGLDTRGAIDQIVDAGREYVERGRRGEQAAAMAGKTTPDIRMSKGARVPENTPAADIDESRFLTRTLEGRTPLGAQLTPGEVKVLRDYLPYVIQHNPDTLDKTAAFIKANGPVLAEEKFFHDDTSILAVVRIPLGRALIKLHGDAAKKATSQQEIDGHRAAGFDLWLKVTELGKEAGQMVQSFAIDAAEMVEMPGGAEVLFNKRVEDVVRGEIDSLPVKMTDVVQAAKEADIKVVDDALVDKRVQERLGTILEGLGATAWRELKDSNTIKAMVDKHVASSKHVAVLKSSKDIRFVLSVEDKIAVAVEWGIDYLAGSKSMNKNDWAAKMTNRFGEGVTPHLKRIWNEMGIMLNSERKQRAPRVSKQTKQGQPTQGQMGQPVTLAAEANRIVRDWLLEHVSIAAPGEIIKQDLAGVVQQLPGPREVPLQKQKTIIESLQELGFTPAEGVMFAAEVQRAAFQRAKVEKAKRLQQLLRGKPISKINQAAIERIMEISSLQRLDEASIIDAFAAKMGLPKLTPEVVSKLQALAEQIRTAPEGSDKVEATRKMMSFIEDQMPLVKSDVFWAMWYANMLSGYQTAERNVLSTANNVTANLATSMLVDPKNAAFALSGFITGIRKGWREAKNIAKTGEFPAHMIAQGKIEAPVVLERNVFKGWARIFNNWKYVFRSMIAEDALFFLPAQESRARMIAADVARAEGKSGKELWTRVAEIMGESQAQLTAFETQARAEGKTGERLQRRIDELAERQRPAEIRAQSIEYAKRGTFNYQPEGVAGILAQKIREASKRVPLLRVIVPFTNIVANVTNTSLDYSPWGAVRVLTGRLQVGGGRRNIVGHERAQLLAKSFIGTTAMVAAYALDRMQGGDDDDDQGWFAIYGSGAGSSAKNNQIRERGWRPWSIRIGKTYYDYRLTPLAIPFGIIGSIRDAERWRKMDEKSIQIRIAFSTLRALSVINDMSFMAGLTEFVEMMNVDSAEQANKMTRSFFARQTIGAITPNLFKQLDRTFDPLVRDNATIMDALLREIPVASRMGSPKMNVLGEPIKQTTGPLSLVIAHGKDDPVWNLIITNEAWISVPSKTQYIGKRRMTETEYYSFIKYRGEILREKIERNLSRFEGRDKEWVNKRIDDYTRDAAESAKRRVKRESR